MEESAKFYKDYLHRTIFDFLLYLKNNNNNNNVISGRSIFHEQFNSVKFCRISLSD